MTHKIHDDVPHNNPRQLVGYEMKEKGCSKKTVRPRRFRLGLVFAICLILIGIAILRSEIIQSVTSWGERPRYIDLSVKTGKSWTKLQIRDPVAIGVLQSFISSGWKADRKSSGSTEFQIFIPPPGKSTYSYSPTPVRRTADGRFVWQRGGRATELNGNLADFVEWLKIRRINQLLRDRNPQQRKLGEQIRDATRAKHTTSLIRIANSKNDSFARTGINDIAEFISIEPATTNHYVPGEIHLPLRRIVSDPNRRIRNELLDLVTRTSATTSLMALQCLQQIGDRATADSLVKQLKLQQGGFLDDHTLTTIEKLYGIPATYERWGICGNSSSEEIAKFAQAQAKRRNAAIIELLNWQKNHLNDSDEKFYDAVLLRWSETLIHIAANPDKNAYGSDRTPARKLTSLLGLGKPVVPAMKRRIQSAADWHETAMLEFCIAILTSECDADLVTNLLAGDVARQRMACCIIAAAADPSWNARLAKFLRTPIPARKVEEVAVLRDVAAQALYRSNVVEALPLLRAAQNEGFESHMILQILSHLDTPQM